MVETVGQATPEGEARQAMDEQPCCAYDLVTRTRLEGLTEQVHELRNRVNALLFTLAAAAGVELLLRMGNS